MTDFAYACASLRAARALAAQRRVVYAYRWAVAPTRSLNVDASAQARPYGAFHGSEVPFVWGAASELATAAERSASLGIASAFAAFAAGTDPSAGLKAAAPLAVDWQPFLSSASDAAAAAVGTEIELEVAMVFGSSNAASGSAAGDAARLSLVNEGAGQAQQCVVWDTICAARHGAGGCSFAPAARGAAAVGGDPALALLVGAALFVLCIGGALALALGAVLVVRARHRGEAISKWCTTATFALQPMRAADDLNARCDDITAAFETVGGAMDGADCGGGGAYVAMGAQLHDAADKLSRETE